MDDKTCSIEGCGKKMAVYCPPDVSKWYCVSCAAEINHKAQHGIIRLSLAVKKVFHTGNSPLQVVVGLTTHGEHGVFCYALMCRPGRYFSERSPSAGSKELQALGLRRGELAVLSEDMRDAEQWIADHSTQKTYTDNCASPPNTASYDVLGPLVPK